jgi:hypothetical protein
MSRLLRPLIALAIAAPAFVSMAGPAVACSCAPQSVKKVLANADAVVAGHVVGEQPIDAVTTHSLLAVDGVYKGKVEATITLNANIGFGGGSSCAVLYPVGSKVDPLVLQRLDDSTYQVAVCDFLSRPEVVKALGAARAPPHASASPSAAAAPAVSSPAVRRGLSWAAVVGGLLLAVGAIGLLRRWSGRRRERHQPTPIEKMQRSARRAAGG